MRQAVEDDGANESTVGNAASNARRSWTATLAESHTATTAAATVDSVTVGVGDAYVAGATITAANMTSTANRARHWRTATCDVKFACTRSAHKSVVNEFTITSVVYAAISAIRFVSAATSEHTLGAMVLVALMIS